MSNVNNSICPISDHIVSIDNHYEFICKAGNGTYGTTWIGIQKFDNKKVAIKAVKKKNTPFESFKREYKYSRTLSTSPNIISTYDILFETKHCYVMIQEFAPCGDLFDSIIPEQGMEETSAKRVISQVALGLQFMHLKRLVHRDIKPENVVIFDHSTFFVKLIDFGMTLKEGTHVARVCGSIPYTPPEICQADSNTGFFVETANDIWSLGVLLFCMLTGTFPWEQAILSDQHFNDFVQWRKNLYSDIAPLWRKFTEPALKMFGEMLNLTLTKRCSVSRVHDFINFDWIRDIVDVYETCESDYSSITRTPIPKLGSDNFDSDCEIDSIQTSGCFPNEASEHQFNFLFFTNKSATIPSSYNKPCNQKIESENLIQSYDPVFTEFITKKDLPRTANFLYNENFLPNSDNSYRITAVAQIPPQPYNMYSFDYNKKEIIPSHRHHFSDSILRYNQQEKNFTDLKLFLFKDNRYTSHSITTC